MRIRDAFLTYESEIEEMAKECGLKDGDVGAFLNYFEQPDLWIKQVVETFNDGLLADRELD